MILLLVVFGVVIIVLLFLYLSLRKDVYGLRKQLDYTNQNESNFTLFTSSSDAQIQALCKEINALRSFYLNEREGYLAMDQNFKDMITKISHDIRTPLTSILGYLQMLEGCLDVDVKKQYYDVIYHRIDFMKELLETLFLYTKITNPSFKVQLESHCLYDILCSSLLPFYPQFQKQGIKMKLDFPDTTLTASVDVLCMERIFHNLLQNVVKHGIHTLEISESKDDTYIWISFCNPTETKNIDLHALFDRFYTADTSRNKHNSGLGLAIVKELIDHQKGTIQAKQENGTFCIQIGLPIRMV